MKTFRYSLYIFFLLISLNLDAARPKRQVVDTVGVRCRGVMESFQGVSSGLEKRLDFYRTAGMTHYFYCPSDDRYCNRWGWKFLYNDSDRHIVRNMMSICRSAGLEFVWTINPGDGYRWNADDYKYLLDKLVMMYYNGIRSFAVDLPEAGGALSSVRDSLLKDFLVTRPEDVSLYMIGELPVAEYPSEGESAVETLMRGYHFDRDFIDRSCLRDAVICNISSSDEFAKLALLSVADFARNPRAYSADESMAAAVESLHGEVKDAFMTFLHHTGKIGESERVETFSLKNWSKEKSDSLHSEFCRIEAVPELIRENVSSEINEALSPWLVEFGRLGTRGKKVLNCMRYYKKGDLGAFWQTYLTAVMSEEEKLSYEKYPVGAGKLQPFCSEALEVMIEGFASMLSGKTELHNLASTLYSSSNQALDSDFTTSVGTSGHMEFAIPVHANTCHLLTGPLPEGKRVIFRQLRTDGSLVAEFVVRSPYTTFDLKDGAVMVDILGDVEVYENIFVYL